MRIVCIQYLLNLRNLIHFRHAFPSIIFKYFFCLFYFSGYKRSIYVSPLAERIRKRKSFADSELDLTSGLMPADTPPSPVTADCVASNDNKNTTTTTGNSYNFSVNGSTAAPTTTTTTVDYPMLPYLLKDRQTFCDYNNNYRNSQQQHSFNNYFRSKLVHAQQHLSVPPSTSSFVYDYGQHVVRFANISGTEDRGVLPKIRIVEESRLKSPPAMTSYDSRSISKPKISFSIESIIGMQ